MKNEIKYAIYLIGLGMGLVFYAHATFTTKEETRDVKEIVIRIDQRVYEMHSVIKK